MLVFNKLNRALCKIVIFKKNKGIALSPQDRTVRRAFLQFLGHFSEAVQGALFKVTSELSPVGMWDQENDLSSLVPCLSQPFQNGL